MSSFAQAYAPLIVSIANFSTFVPDRQIMEGLCANAAALIEQKTGRADRASA